VSCLGWVKITCFRACCRAAGHMDINKREATAVWSLRLEFGFPFYTGTQVSGLLLVQFSKSGRGCAARRARVAVQARAQYTGRACMGTVSNGPCRAWAGPKSGAFRRVGVMWAIWTSIPLGSHSFSAT
jgi:hypothetical protein